jgi:RIO kinase 1
MAVNRSREAWKTYGNVFDQFTINNLRKLSTQGYFEELTTSVALGKEANVFAGETKEGGKVAVKIYRLENCNFNKMYEYISQDPRYLHLRGDKRRIIFAWTQREYRNLMKAREVIRVPTPLAFKDNIVVMEYLEEFEQPATQLKNVEMEAPQEVFDEIILNVKKLWKAGLVHGDLSEFNILIQQERPVFIDFSQATATDGANAKELLKRDLEVLCRFFRKHGVEKTPEELFRTILD